MALEAFAQIYQSSTHQVVSSTLSDYMITIFHDRHSGMDSHQAILPA